LGTVRFTIRGGRLRYKRYDALGNSIYSLKSMLVDMGAAMYFFLYEVAYVLAEIINIWYLIN
jgi:hypothetical protein